MKSQTSIKKNFIYQMIYQILIIILPFVTSPYIARTIGAEGLGTYSYSYSIAYYFVLFSMLCLANYGNRAVAQCRDNQKNLNETFSNIVTLHIAFSFICCVVYILYVFFLANEKLYAGIQFTYVLSGLFDVSWFYFGIEKFKLTVTRNIIIKILNVVCVFVFVRNANDLWKYCAIMAVGMLISQISLWFPLNKFVAFQKPTWKKMKPHIEPLLILFIPAIAVSLYKYMDKIMIGAMSNKTQLGFYENAEKVINIPLTIITSFGTVMLPKMSNLVASHNREKTNQYISLSMKYVMCLSFALAFGLAGIGKVFAPVFWGQEFMLSGVLIMGLSITIPFMSFANIIRTQFLIPSEKDKEYLSSVIGGAVVNLIANTLLISKIGAIGATIGTILAEIFVCVIQTLSVRKELPVLRYIKSIWMFAVFGVAMFVGVFYIGNALENKVSTLFLQIICGMLIYGTFCVIYFVHTKDEMILKMLRGIKGKIR